MNTEQRLALQAKADELQAEITKLRSELAAEKENPWEPWRPEVGDQYYFVDGQGLSLKTRWDYDDYDTARHAISNVFPTEAAAERHALRMRSMRPTCPVPKVGDEYWAVSVLSTGTLVDCYEWEGDTADRDTYNMGRAHATKEAAEAWIAEFGEAWTTLEDEA
jgi:hypothetical protein